MNKLNKSLTIIGFGLLLMLVIYGLSQNIKSIHFKPVAECFVIFIVAFFVIEKINFRQKYFFLKRFKITYTDLKYLFISGIICLYLFTDLNRIFFDDSGFTLRYLDNFKEGYYYTYNIQEGPVYGISSFFYLNFCFLIQIFTQIKPGHVLMVANLTGLFCTLFLLFKILQHYITKESLLFFVWITVIFTAKQFLNVVFSGMETSVHLSVVLAAIFFSLKNKQKVAFLFLALAIISKLDALSVALVLFVFLFIINFKKEAKWFKIFTVNAVIWAGVPVVIFIVFTLIVFGSPIPHSAMAKVYHYPHPDNTFFPFLSTFLSSIYYKVALIIFLIMFTLNLTFLLLNKHFFTKIDFLIPGKIFILMMLMYYFYNPAEKMLWYYALPVFFMMFQIFLTSAFLIQLFREKITQSLILTSIFLLFVFLRIDVRASVRWLKTALHITENERILIGEYLGKISDKNDILLSKHGHISRNFNGFVLDNSGLNSKTTTDFKLNTDSLIKHFSPNYLINHAYPGFIDNANNNLYKIKNIFYDIAMNDGLVWLLFEKSDNHYLKLKLQFIQKANIENIEDDFSQKNSIRLKGNNLQLNIEQSDKLKASRVIFGIIRFQQAFDSEIKLICEKDTLIKSLTVKKIGADGEICRFVQETQLEIKENFQGKNLKIQIRNNANNGFITILNPFIEYNITE